MKALGTGMYALDGVPEFRMELYRRALTFVNPTYTKAAEAGADLNNIPPTLEAWRVGDDGFFRVPRYFAPQLREDGFDIERRPAMNAGVWPHKIVNPPKDERQLGVIRELEGITGDIGMQLPCGAGKTYLSLRYASQQPGRILVVVPTVVKRDEWVREICFHMGLQPDQIGLIQGPSRDYADKPVVVAVLNTLAFQDFNEHFCEAFGAVIWDEAHLVGAPALSKALGKANGWQVALTATPGRGARRRLLELHCGNRWIERSNKTLEGMTFHFVMVPVPPHIKAAQEWRWQKLRVSKNRAYNAVAFNYARAAIERDRRMLVVHGYVDPLLQINNFCHAGGLHNGGYVIGDSSLKEIAHQEIEARFEEESSWPKKCRAYKEWAKANANPLLVTGLTKKQPGGVGMDVPDLDAGVIMLPISDPDMTQQLVGRWERDVEKKPPQIVVLTPATNIGKNMGKSMANKIQQLGLAVQFHNNIPPGYTLTP